MQLKIKAIAAPLAAATCTLLGEAASGDADAQELALWDIDTSMLVYAESDGRIRDVSVNALARKELREDSFLGLTLALDTLTGASPSGAVRSHRVQTFTRPSGDGQYTVAPGEQPLDTTFQDTRVALAASWEWPISRLALASVGASFSDEYDYTHAGINAKLARDFNERNTTLSFGAALANDTIDPVGGAPLALAPMLGLGDLSNRAGGGLSKDVLDLLVGVTQVVSRHMVVQLDYSLSRSDGYLTDPYKVLSVVDPATGDPVAGPAGSGLDLYLFEKRPETREKQSVFALVKRDLGGDVLDASYRYMTDDWGVASHTLDLRYRWNFGAGQYLQPHLRFYRQSAADFYRTVLFQGSPLPQSATADQRLGEIDGVTVGLKYGRRMHRGELAGRLEWYTQTGTPSAGSAVGSLAKMDLFPDMNAIVGQLTYKFGR